MDRLTLIEALHLQAPGNIWVSKNAGAPKVLPYDTPPLMESCVMHRAEFITTPLTASWRTSLYGSTGSCGPLPHHRLQNGSCSNIVPCRVVYLFRQEMNHRKFQGINPQVTSCPWSSVAMRSAPIEVILTSLSLSIHSLISSGPNEIPRSLIPF